MDIKIIEANNGYIVEIETSIGSGLPKSAFSATQLNKTVKYLCRDMDELLNRIKELLG